MLNNEKLLVIFTVILIADETLLSGISIKGQGLSMKIRGTVTLQRSVYSYVRPFRQNPISQPTQTLDHCACVFALSYQ